MRIPGTTLDVAFRPDPSPAATVALAEPETTTQRVSVVELADSIERALASRDLITNPRDGAAGVDGNGSWYQDDLAGGHDPTVELNGRLKYLLYREMRIADPAVRSLEWLFKLPARSADWRHEPAKRDPDGPEAARARADFADWQFGLGDYFGDGRLDLSHDALLQQELLFLSYGAMGGEIIWPKELEVWHDGDGNPHQCRPISRIGPRMASTVDKIVIDEVSGAIDHIIQDLPGAKPIPGAKLTWLTNEREGNNLWGQSLLRAVYGPWRIKKALMLSAAIGWDRWSVGTPVVRHPAGKKREAQEIARSIRVHERGWVTFEGPTPEQGGDWGIDLLNGTGTLADPTPLLRYYDSQIAAAGLQQFSSLGNSEHGSRAVGETLSEPFYLAVQAIVDQIREERMRKVLRRLWDVNFGPGVPIPTLKVSKIQGRNVSLLTRAIADLSSAGFSFVDPDTQNNVRDLLDLPGLPEDVGVAPVALLPPAQEGDSIQ